MNWETNDGLLRSLESAIRKAIVDGLPFDRPTTTELEKASLSELLFWFGCWRARRIARQPRMVHWSESCLYSRKRAVYAAELSVIAHKFAGGDDLNPHLSRSAGRAHVPGQPSTGFPADSEVDRMLSDWGVHHLHLSNSLSSNGFTMRTRDLLFCCVIARTSTSSASTITEAGQTSKCSR